MQRVSFHLPEQRGLPDEEEVDSAHDDEEGGDDSDKGELRLEPVDGEEVEEEDGVGDHPGHLDIEEADLLLHHGLLQGAAQDEEVGPGKEDADQERIFLIQGDLVLVQVFPDAGQPEEARNQQEDGEVRRQGDLAVDLC